MNKCLSNKIKRVVVKVGTKVLTSKKFRLNKTWIKNLVAQIADLADKNIEVILVSSGAIGAGMGMLKLNARPKLLPKQQAAAAIGQGQLMKIYDSFFKAHKLLSAQVLLTREDLSNRKRYLNAKNTLLTLMNYKAIPVINENDTVSVDEIKFGDNDKLSALVANLVHADLLVILSDVDGLYDGKKRVISKVNNITHEIERLATDCTGCTAAVGGMVSKIEAAKICTAAGVTCVIANGKTKDILHNIIDQHKVGTIFLPKGEQLVAKKRWIGFSAHLKGQVFVDEGARQALTLRNKSLLPKGITNIRGEFAVGDTVSIMDVNKVEFARGMSNYSSDELARIKGKKSEKIKTILGYKYYDEVIHRDNLVIL